MTRVKDIINALRDCNELQGELSDAQRDYNGYSFGYAYGSLIERCDSAYLELEQVFDAYITERVDAALKKSPLPASDIKSENAST
jgi:hypothetical protein